MYFEWYYYFGLSTPIIPLSLSLILLKKFKHEKIYKSLLLLFSIDFITNVLTIFFEINFGNVFPILNVSLVIQSVIIFKIFKDLNKIGRQTNLFLILIIFLIFIFESFKSSNIWVSNELTLMLTHIVVVTIGWRALYNSYKDTSGFEFRILSNIVLYNTVFLLVLFFESKIKLSTRLYEFLFFFISSLYIGANMSYGRSIWLLRKN